MKNFYNLVDLVEVGISVNFLNSNISNTLKASLINFLSKKRKLKTKSSLIASAINKVSPESDIQISEDPERLDIDMFVTSEASKLDTSHEIIVAKCNDIIIEAKEIINAFKSNLGSKFVLATNNQPLAETVRYMLQSSSDNEKTKRIWLSSMECLFRICNDFYTNLCASDYYASDKSRKEKSESIQEAIESSRSSIKLGPNYRFGLNLFFKAHADFVEKIYGILPDEDIIKWSNSKKQVTNYEYCNQFRSYLDQKHISKPNDLFEIVELKELAWIAEPDIVWIGGAINNTNDYSCVNFISNSAKVYASYSVFQDSGVCYKNQYFSKNKSSSRMKHISSTQTKYLDPCPRLELRNNTFAINHVTKLINNPLSFYTESILSIKQSKFHQNHIFGIIIHSIFESYIKGNSNPIAFSQMKDEVHKIIDQYNLHKRDKLMVQRKTYIMCEALFPILQNADELYPEMEGVLKLVHKGKEFMLHGRADLVYKDKAGRYGVVDFKTGVPPSWINIMNGNSPQISLEMLMLKFGGFVKDTKIELAPSGFISPKGFFVVNSEDVIIEASIKGIINLIDVFWEQGAPYKYCVKDESSVYQLIARNFA